MTAEFDALLRMESAMYRTSTKLSRRKLLGGMTALSAVALAGCGRSDEGETTTAASSTAGQLGPTRLAAMTVYRDPNCGCCEAWADIASKAGYKVSVVDRPDMDAVKKQYGVPDNLRSCHTALVGAYAIEGHVPLAHVKRLLDRKPAGIKGLAVPGMPRGSPGMEMPDGSKDAYQVMAFDAAGQTTAFAT